MDKSQLNNHIKGNCQGQLRKKTPIYEEKRTSEKVDIDQDKVYQALLQCLALDRTHLNQQFFLVNFH